MSDAWTKLIWRDFRDGLLTRTNRDVALVLAKFRGRGGEIFPAHATLAARANCCVRSVRRALDALAALGRLSWRERRCRVGQWATRRTSNLYHLIVGNADVPTTGQKAAVASLQESFSLITVRIADPMADEARETLARVRAERERKIAQGWLAARPASRPESSILIRS